MSRPDDLNARLFEMQEILTSSYSQGARLRLLSIVTTILDERDGTRPLFGPERPPIPEPSTVEATRGREPGPRDLRAKAALWIEKNPELWAAMEESALALGRERKRFGMKHVAEHVRWNAPGPVRGSFKISNDVVAYLARKLAADHPEIESKLSFRSVRW